MSPPPSPSPSLAPNDEDRKPDNALDDTLPPDLRVQLTLMGVLRFCETTAWTSVFPYAYFLMRDMPEKPPLEKIPFLASLVIAAYTFCEFLGNIPFAYLSDRVGRRPILLFGILANCVFCVWFGFARSVWAVIVLRAIQGLMNPNVGMIGTCTAECVGGHRKQLLAKSFSYVTLIRSVALLVGPFIGGSLADPASRWPETFGQMAFFVKYPYFLPNVFVGGIETIVFFAMFFWFKETHPEFKNRADIGLRLGRVIARYFGLTSFIYDYEEPDKSEQWGETTGLLSSGSSSRIGDDATLEGSSSDEESVVGYGGCSSNTATPPDTPKKIKRTYTPQVRYLILIMALIAFHKSSSDIMNPSLLAIPVEPPANDGNPLHFSGGFGLNTSQVGNMLILQAVIGSGCQLVIPTIVKRLGALQGLRLSLCVYPFVYLITPWLVRLPSWLGLAGMLVCLWFSITVVSLAYACHAILLTSTAPSMEAIGRINGACASFGALLRSVGPSLSGTVFGWGLELGYIIIPYWLLATAAATAAIVVPWLRDEPDEDDD